MSWGGPEDAFLSTSLANYLDRKELLQFLHSTISVVDGEVHRPSVASVCRLIGSLKEAVACVNMMKAQLAADMLEACTAVDELKSCSPVCQPAIAEAALQLLGRQLQLVVVEQWLDEQFVWMLSVTVKQWYIHGLSVVYSWLARQLPSNAANSAFRALSSM